MNDQQTQIQKMLTALLKANDQIHYIGSYAHGLTKEGTPYVVLFPAADYLEFQVCRVYAEQFARLPEFIPRETPPNVTPSKYAPKKDIATGCPVFCVLTYPGKDTQMGPETRFSDVLFVTKSKDPKPAPAPAPAANGKTQPAPAPVAHRHSAAGGPVPTPAPVQPPKTLTHFCPKCETYPVDVAGEWCEACRRDGEVVTLTTPHPPRPWSPAYLKAYIAAKVETEIKPQLSKGQRNVIAKLIESVIADETAEQKRHLVLSYLFNQPKLSQLTDSQAYALYKWLKPAKDTSGEYVTDRTAAAEILDILKLLGAA